MEFPIEIQRLNNEYARPCTRPDWKKGSYYNRGIVRYNRLSRCPSRYKFSEIINLIYHVHVNRHRRYEFSHMNL